MINRSTLKTYIFYILNTLIKLAIWFYIASVYSSAEFILFNLYLFSADVALTIMSAGSTTTFARRQPSGVLLKSVLILEITMFLFLALLGPLMRALHLLPSSIHLTTLFSFTLLKASNQIFSRYEMYKGRINQALFNDLIGNSLWGPICLLLAFLGWLNSTDEFVSIWTLILAINSILNLKKYRRDLWGKERPLHWRALAGDYFASLQFTAAGKVFGNLEKLIASAKFSAPLAVSSYFMMCKVIGLGAELTGGFFNTLLCNRLDSLDRESQSHFGVLERLVALSFATYLFAALTIHFMSPFLAQIFANQLTPEYLPLFQGIIVIYFSQAIHGLFSFALQRYRRLTYLNLVGLSQFALLAGLYLTPISISQFVLSQAVFSVGIVFADCFHWLKIKPSAPLTPKT